MEASGNRKTRKDVNQVSRASKWKVFLHTSPEAEGFVMWCARDDGDLDEADAGRFKNP